MAVERDIKSLKEATALRLQVERRLVELLEKRRDQVEGVKGVPGANADLLELELQRHAYETVRAIESGFTQRRQYWTTLAVAGAAALATLVYAIAYVLKEYGG